MAKKTLCRAVYFPILWTTIQLIDMPEVEFIELKSAGVK
jgi:hypothetical protein